MQPSYLTHSPTAWASVALIVLGFLGKWIIAITGLPAWLVPVGYFVALFGAGLLFVGWVRWKASREP